MVAAIFGRPSGNALRHFYDPANTLIRSKLQRIVPMLLGQNHLATALGGGIANKRIDTLLLLACIALKQAHNNARHRVETRQPRVCAKLAPLRIVQKRGNAVGMLFGRQIERFKIGCQPKKKLVVRFYHLRAVERVVSAQRSTSLYSRHTPCSRA